MALVIGPSDATRPRREASHWVEVKSSWSGSWTPRPDLVAVRADWRSGSDGLSTLEIERPYGPAVRDPAGSAQVREPLDIAGWWARVILADSGGTQTLWCGRVESDVRDIEGASSGRSGHQRWLCAGPERLLERAAVWRSVWYDSLRSDGHVYADWLPPMNARGPGGTLVGNRGPAIPDAWSTYVYGRGSDGYGIWTHRQYLEYILRRFVERDSAGSVLGPVWSIGGQVDALDTLVTIQDWPPATNAMAVFRRLVDPAFGLDFCIHPTSSGFELRVFSLLPFASVASGATMPANPLQVEIETGLDVDIDECVVESSDAQRSDKVTVLGERKMVCATFTIASGQLRPGWTAEQESAYAAGTGNATDDIEKHDQARADDRFRDVYQAFLADTDLDLSRLGDGAVQAIARTTLPHCLLEEGVDYSTTPPTRNAPSTQQQDLLPPFVCAYHYTTERYVPVDQLGVASEELGQKAPNVSVSALERALGVRLRSTPNHALARGIFSATNSSFIPAMDGGVAYTTFRVTIAAELDERLSASYEISQSLAAGDGSEMVIEAPCHEYWLLKSGTVVGVTPDGALATAPADYVLRDDSSRLAALLAGAVARYLYGRIAARIRWRRMEAWTSLVGQMLAAVDEDATGATVATPVGVAISSVSWDFRRRTTEVRTGHAQ